MSKSLSCFIVFNKTFLIHTAHSQSGLNANIWGKGLKKLYTRSETSCNVWRFSSLTSKQCTTCVRWLTAHFITALNFTYCNQRSIIKTVNSDITKDYTERRYHLGWKSTYQCKFPRLDEVYLLSQPTSINDNACKQAAMSIV